MSAGLEGVHVLFAGESWLSQGTHSKGWASYDSSSYEEGGTPLIDALRASGAELTYLPNHAAVEAFPRSLAELRGVDVVILSDIPSDTLLLEKSVFIDGIPAPNRLDVLRQHVYGGAGLLMVGGYMSFSGIGAKARYGMTALADALPVTVLSSDDRMEQPQGVAPTRCIEGHPILTGINTSWPRFLGYNAVRLKSGADMLLSFGEDPCLVVQNYGRGRSAAFTSDCSPHWGSREFLEWPDYARFWSNLVAWLAFREPAQDIEETNG